MRVSTATMAEDGLRTATPSREGPMLDPVEAGVEPSMLLQKLRSNISKNIQSKVDLILREVHCFSDSDKLYLYLQLPSRPGMVEKSDSDSSSFNTSDQLHACNWIRGHLEEHADTCLPKHDVYEAYRRYCDNLRYRCLSAANFGKIIRDIFPNIKARRLGGRGQSKYCYSGIRRKSVLNMPLLPSLDLKNDPSELTELVQTYRQEVTEAACELICDWAQKILKRSFHTVVEIAHFLVQEHILNPRCSQAELLTSAHLAGGSPKPHKVPNRNMASSKGGGADREGGGPENKKDRERGDEALPGRREQAGKGVERARGTAGVRGRDLQVEAVVKRYPQLLPRGSVPDKALPSAPPPAGGCPPPPPLTPTGALKVTLPITMTTLPQQPGGATTVFNMVLAYPEKEAVPVTLTTAPGPTPGVLQKPRPPSVAKRAPDPPLVNATGTNTPKKKRGRPRKPRPNEAGHALAPPPAAHALSPFTGGVIQKASCSSSSSSLSQQPLLQAETLEMVIPDQPLRLLPTAPASCLEVPPHPAPGGGASVGTDSPRGQQRGVVVQCYRADSRPVLVLQGPEVGVGGATVEAIQHGPTVTRVVKAHPLVEQEEEVVQEVEIILTPVDSLPKPPSATNTS